MELIAKWQKTPEVSCTLEFDEENYDEEVWKYIGVPILNGELQAGAEYTEGQYIYKYMYEMNGNGWEAMEAEGWGVALIDKQSTDAVTTPLCTTINNKPIASMAYMFTDSNAVSIDTSSFKTENVENMEYMFTNAKIKEINTSDLDTRNVKKMKGMFADTKFDYLDLSYFDMSKVEDINAMFHGSDVSELNLDGWDLSSLYFDSSSTVNFDIFSNNENLEKISTKNWKLGEYAQRIFNISSLKSVDVTGWDLSNTYSTERLFENSTNLTEIKGLKTWDTSNVQNMYKMFYNCNSLIEIDVSGFSANNLYNADSMFYRCDNLQKLNLTGFNFMRASESFSNFVSTTKDLEVILDGFDLSSSYELPHILNIFPTATTLSCKDWILPDYSYSIFENTNGINNNITRIDVTGWDLSNASDISSLFKENNNLTEIIGLETWNTSNISNMESMFESCTSLNEINGINKWNTSNLANMEKMFYNCSNIESIDLSNFKNDNLYTIKNMFTGCSKLKNINLSNFNITVAEERDDFLPNNENMSIIADNWEFDYNPYISLSSLLKGTEKISCKNWTLPDDAYGMMSGDSLSTLKEIDVTNWNLSNTTSLNSLFSNNRTLTTIKGLDTWNTSNVTDMSYMFTGCSSLTNLDLSNFDTSNVTEMSNMFSNNNELTTIDISGFNTSNVESAYNMFSYCPKLTTIYATESFNTDNMYEDDSMFDDDELLVGGAGTEYDEEKVDKEYAHLDGGVSNPGYFSERLTLKVVFNPNGGTTPISNKFVNPNSQVGELPTPTKNDGIFMGWYTSPIDGIKVETDTIINNNITFYARWRKSIGAAILENETIEISPGSNTDIVITNDDEIDETYTYSSNDTNIATVDENGTI